MNSKIRRINQNLISDSRDGLHFATDPTFYSLLPSYLLPAVKSLGFPILNSTLNCDQGKSFLIANIYSHS